MFYLADFARGPTRAPARNDGLGGAVLDQGGDVSIQQLPCGDVNDIGAKASGLDK